MAVLLDELGVAARIESGRWKPVRRELNLVELARFDDERVRVEGSGESVEVEPKSFARRRNADTDKADLGQPPPKAGLLGTFTGLADGRLWESRDLGENWTPLQLHGDVLDALVAPTEATP
jgi:hypothetical protein